jgi:predicted DNA-binding mobile mystery protein A
MSRTRKLPPEMKNLRLRQLEDQLTEIERLRRVPGPRRGWIRAIRESLGMEVRQLAVRADLSPASISEIEKREAEGAITLASLQRIAEAMGADLVYALVPRIPLNEMRKAQAQSRAEQLVGHVSHTMALEAQSTDDAARAEQTIEVADTLLRTWSAKLWEKA